MIEASQINPEKFIPKEEAVLCFLRDRQEKKLLLIHKKTGLGAGLINAPGGRVEPGETHREAAVRETKEEVGLCPLSPRFAGDLYFQFLDGYSLKGSVFTAEAWEGQAGETPEAKPFWCPEDEIPYHKMWADDSWWLPLLLEERPFRGKFVFDKQDMLSLSLELNSSSQALPRASGLYR